MGFDKYMERIATAVERLAGKAEPNKDAEPNEDVPTAQESPRVIFGRARMLDGRHVKISRVYLGAQIPDLDDRGNYVEKYTTLYRIEDGEWFSNSVARSLIKREGILAGLKSQEAALTARGVDALTVSWSSTSRS